MTAKPPRPNPAVYPRMYTPEGKLLHRAESRGTLVPLCHAFSDLGQRAVEGHEAHVFERLIVFDTTRAASLTPCPRCKELAGRFA